MMLLSMFKYQPWFRAKRYGYGAGLPTKWQGRALLASHLLALGGVKLLADRPDALSRGTAFSLFLIFTAALIIISKKRTDGEWKWRNGDPD